MGKVHAGQNGRTRKILSRKVSRAVPWTAINAGSRFGCEEGRAGRAPPRRTLRAVQTASPQLRGGSSGVARFFSEDRRRPKRFAQRNVRNRFSADSACDSRLTGDSQKPDAGRPEASHRLEKARRFAGKARFSAI
jgi:hypothetical protein